MEHKYIDGYCYLCGISKNNIRALSPCRETYKPQENPKEGDVEYDKNYEMMQAAQRMCASKQDPNSNSGLGSALLAAPDQYRLTARQQIRIAALNAAIALLTCEDIDKDRDLAAEETAVKAAAKFESYILNGTQDDGEKQDG